MSVFGKVVAGLSKAESFLLTIFTKGAQVASVLSKLSPPVMAAMTAVFYDVAKTVTSATATAAAVKVGDVPLVITLSGTTLALVKQVVTDSVAGEQLVVADLKALGIIPEDKAGIAAEAAA